MTFVSKKIYSSVTSRTHTPTAVLKMASLYNMAEMSQQPPNIWQQVKTG
jgi:hypothetical protein